MFSVGNVLATTFRVWLRSFPRWLVIALVFHVPLGVWYALHYHDAALAVLTRYYYAPIVDAHPVLNGYTASGMWIIYAYAYGAIAIAVVAKLRNERTSLGAALLGTVRRWFALLVVAFVLQLVTVGVISLGVVVLWDRHAWQLRGYGTYLVISAIWCLLMARLIPIGPTVVIEGRGIGSAIRRGLELGRGHSSKLFALCLFWTALIVALQYGLYELIVPSPYDGLVAYESRSQLYAWVMVGVDLAFSTLWAVSEVVVYEHLREAREGPAPTQLDRVFA